MDDFTGWIKNHLILVGVMLIIAIGLLIKKPPTASAPSTTANNADLSGLQKDANGNPIVYRDVADTFISYSLVEGSYNNPVTTTSTTTVNPNPTQPVASSQPDAPSHPAQPVEHPIESHPSQPTPTHTYTIVSGDTLSAIAGRYGTDWQTLYSKNKATIDATSNQHGNPIPGGPWNNIFPNETLVL